MGPETGDVLCKLLIVAGTLTVVIPSVRWWIGLVRGAPVKDILLRWRREDDRLTDDGGG